MTGKTALVDLNLEAGGLSSFLGLDPDRSIADMAAHRGGLTRRPISAYVTRYSSGLDLLAAPEEVNLAEKIAPEFVFELLQELREDYEHVVLDLQHTVDAATVAALDQSDKIILVLSLDIPAIRSAMRALQIFDRAGYSRRKIRVVVNRWSKNTDLGLREVEELICEPVLGSLQSDYRTVARSVNLGKPLVEIHPRSKISRQIRKIALTLTSGSVQEEDGKSRRSWNCFLKRSLPHSGPRAFSQNF